MRLPQISLLMLIADATFRRHAADVFSAGFRRQPASPAIAWPFRFR